LKNQLEKILGYEPSDLSDMQGEEIAELISSVKKDETLCEAFDKRRNIWRTLIIQGVFYSVKSILLKGSMANIVNWLELLKSFQTYETLNDVSEMLAPIFPTSFAVTVCDNQNVDVSAFEIAHVLFWLRQLDWTGALRDTKPKSASGNGQFLSFKTHSKFSCQLRELYLAMFYISKAAADEPLDKFDEAYADRVREWVFNLDCNGSAPQADLGYINSVFRAELMNEFPPELPDTPLHNNANAIKNLRRFIEFLNGTFFNERISVMIMGDRRIEFDENATKVTFSNSGINANDASIRYKTIVAFEYFKRIPTFLFEVSYLLSSNVCIEEEEISDETLADFYPKLKAIVLAHLKSHSTFRLYRRYDSRHQFNIVGDGFCAGRSAHALVLRAERIQDVFAAKNDPACKFTEQDYVNVRHIQRHHDTLCNDFEKLQNLYENAVDKIETILAELKLSYQNVTDVNDCYHRLQRSLKYITGVNKSGKRHRMLGVDAWCELHTAPLFAVCLFGEQLPLMLFARNNDPKFMPNYMLLMSSTLPMQGETPDYNNANCGLPWSYADLRAMTSTLHSNAMVYNGSDHYFVGDIDHPELETR
jgi:hypothetical protein